MRIISATANQITRSNACTVFITHRRQEQIFPNFSVTSFIFSDFSMVEGILSELLPAGLCDTVFTVSSTLVSSSYRSSRLGLSHWDPFAMRGGGCLELYYCNMVEWSWWDSSLIWKTTWFPSVLWHCWFGHMTCKNRPRYDL